MSKESLYKKDSRVWISHVNKVWESAVIVEDYNIDKENLSVETESDRGVIVLNIKSTSDLPLLCDLEDFAIDEKKNLVALRSVHEACVLDKLRFRFKNKCFYNYCGVTTVFLNPFFKSTPHEFDNIFNYRGQTIDDLRPHIFAVTEKIYCRLQREQLDQSIIFTGKSGAGKTENAKQAILYLVTVTAEDDKIKDKIFASSVILESFGNAKAISNDNSSRFGKFIEMQYDANYHLIGASVKIFLLDRSRVVYQMENEQNYNIFYELCSTHNARFLDLQLDKIEFHYLKRRDSPEICSSYSKRFAAVMAAFNTLGFTNQQQDEILNILVAILLLGNLSINKFENLGESENARSCYIADTSQLETLAEWFSLDVSKSVKAMRKWMCHKKIFSGQTEITQPMSKEEAVKARDTLVKLIYTKLFIWIVGKINFLFRSPCNVQLSIGILDFCGFVKLDVNLYEQFCINYTNEKIQQQFIQSVFKLEQEEYLRDNIGWSFMKYHDNRLCVELLEGKNGIIDIMEQETNNKAPREIPWINTVFESERCTASKHFERPKCADSTDFIIHHFVDGVQYDSREFLEKNRDTVLPEHLGILKDTQNKILNKLVTDEYCRTSIPREKKSKPRSKPRGSLVTYQIKTAVMSDFRKSLVALTSELKKTSAHFVRCIRSNDEGKSQEFDPVCVAQQIRAYNVLDTIKLSSKGYFSRQKYGNFFDRYHCLCQFEGIQRDNPHETCREIVYTYIEDMKNVKFGECNIFLKEESINHLESLRREKQRRASTLIQKTVRRLLQQKRYQEMKRAVKLLQVHVRKYLVRRRARLDQASHDQEQENEPTAPAMQNDPEHPQERDNVAMDEAGIVPSAAEQQEEIQRNVDDQQSIQAKNRIVNQIILDKIQTLKDLGEKKVKTVDPPLIEDHQDVDERTMEAVDLPVPNEEDVGEITMKAADLPASNEEAVSKIRMQAADPPVINEGVVGEIRMQAVDLLVINEEDVGEIRMQAVDLLVINEEDVGEIKMEVADLSVLNEEDIGEIMMKAAELPVPNEEAVGEIRMQAADLPVINEEDVGEIIIKAADLPVINEEAVGEIKMQAVELPVLNEEAVGEIRMQVADLPVINEEAVGEIRMQAVDLPVINEEDPGEIRVEPADLHVINELQLAYEKSRKVNKNSLNEVYKSLMSEEEDFFLYEPLFQASFKFDQRMEALFEAFGLSRPELEQATPPRRNANNRLDHQRIVNFQGMFEFDTTHINTFVTRLVELPASTITEQEPGLPSRILFMCLRYLDSQGDFQSASVMLDHYRQTVTSVAEARRELGTFFVWLVNTHQLVNYLKQYAGIRNDVVDKFHAFNTDRQTEQCLVNFDLTRYYESLLLIAKDFAAKAVMHMKTTIAEYAPQGILQYNRNPIPIIYSENSDTGEEGMRDAEEIGDPFEIQIQELIYQSIQELAPVQGQELPRQAQEPVQEQNQELPQEQDQELAREQIQELPQEEVQAQEQAQEQNQERPQEQVEEQARDQAQEPMQGQEQNEELEDQDEQEEGEPDQDYLRSRRDMLERLTDFLQEMRRCGLEREMILQMFKKLFDFMSTILLRNLLSRSELCNSYRATLARMNLRMVERWALHNKLTVATTALGPIKQAMRLFVLQPVYNDDIKRIRKYYDKLSSKQIVKILSCYEPAYPADTHIPPDLKRTLNTRVLALLHNHDDGVLLNSEEYLISFPFRHCYLKLEEVEIPATFNLPMLTKI